MFFLTHARRLTPRPTSYSWQPPARRDSQRKPPTAGCLSIACHLAKNAYRYWQANTRYWASPLWLRRADKRSTTQTRSKRIYPERQCVYISPGANWLTRARLGEKYPEGNLDYASGLYRKHSQGNHALSVACYMAGKGNYPMINVNLDSLDSMAEIEKLQALLKAKKAEVRKAELKAASAAKRSAKRIVGIVSRGFTRTVVNVQKVNETATAQDVATMLLAGIIAEYPNLVESFGYTRKEATEATEATEASA